MVHRLAAACDVTPEHLVDEMIGGALAARGEELSGLKALRLAWGLTVKETAQRLRESAGVYPWLERTGRLSSGYIWAWCGLLGTTAEELIPLVERRPGNRFRLAADIAEDREARAVFLSRNGGRALCLLRDIRKGSIVLKPSERLYVARLLRMSVEQLEMLSGRDACMAG
jgi:hypothetical protein